MLQSLAERLGSLTQHELYLIGRDFPDWWLLVIDRRKDHKLTSMLITNLHHTPVVEAISVAIHQRIGPPSVFERYVVFCETINFIRLRNTVVVGIVPAEAFGKKDLSQSGVPIRVIEPQGRDYGR